LWGGGGTETARSEQAALLRVQWIRLPLERVPTSVPQINIAINQQQQFTAHAAYKLHLIDGQLSSGLCGPLPECVEFAASVNQAQAGPRQCAREVRRDVKRL
jgi:hypothetical protein